MPSDGASMLALPMLSLTLALKARWALNITLPCQICMGWVHHNIRCDVEELLACGSLAQAVQTLLDSGAGTGIYSF